MIIECKLVSIHQIPAKDGIYKDEFQPGGWVGMVDKESILLSSNPVCPGPLWWWLGVGQGGLGGSPGFSSIPCVSWPTVRHNIDRLEYYEMVILKQRFNTLKRLYILLCFISLKRCYKLKWDNLLKCFKPLQRCNPSQCCVAKKGTVSIGWNAS